MNSQQAGLTGYGMPSANQTRRVALYLRFSSDLQNPRSIDDQKRECLEYVSRHGWQFDPAHVYIDEAVSGAIAGRAQYQAMKQAAADSLFDCVIVHDLSRLGRDLKEGISIFEDFQQYGVSIVSVADGVDTGARDELLNYGMRALFNQHFLADMKKKVMRGLKGRALDGKGTGGSVYGYRIRKPEESPASRAIAAEIAVNPEQAKVVVQIFEWRAAGKGYKRISKALAAAGIPSPRFANKGVGDPTWSSGTLVALIRQPKYRGHWVWNQNVLRRDPKTGLWKRYPKPESEWIVQVREGLRIVSDNLWYSAQPDPSGRNIRKQSPEQALERGKFLLSGLLKCSECGSNLVAITSRGCSAYSCNKHRVRGNKACTNNLRVSRTLVEDIMLAEIQSHFLDPDVILKLAAELHRKLNEMTQPTAKRIRDAERRVSDLKTQAGCLVEFVMKGDTSDTIRAKLAETERELRLLEQEIAAIRESEKRPKPLPSPEWVKARVLSIRDLFNSRPGKILQIRTELQRLLDGPIVMTPTIAGKKRHYVATVKGRRAAFLQEFAWCHSDNSPTGNRTPVWWLRTTRPNP